MNSHLRFSSEDEPRSDFEQEGFVYAIVLQELIQLMTEKKYTKNVFGKQTLEGA